ncbi:MULTISPECIES: DUF4810 domain-containing protein [Serratia]|uniref:DUF4810 domain-containing protein n=1 Tax=Serratia TaxID=613 RepID=UPI000CF6033E|nr:MULTISPECIES: DUF4810 domain-containing protein [Serratia]AVJ16786.1 DUF4810 domain-containing protein [Serratia sp. MYb239]MEB6335763.1 DUF4810 domain-containing protein [Serratia rhizosphaerae]QPT14784.1 DUF4810 domain-containing protein [Serratia rubidaea]
MTIKNISGVLLAATLLAGCAAPKTLYNWDHYQTTLYQYYQQDGVSTEQQIATLNQTVETSRAKNKAVPPGLHAQLGLLYAKSGRPDQAFTEFNTEKRLFPESARFMDFLMAKDKGSFK